MTEKYHEQWALIKLIYDIKKIAHRKDPLQTGYGVDRLYIYQ